VGVDTGSEVQPWQDAALEDLREQYREMAERELIGDRVARDAAGKLDRGLWVHAAGLGLLGLCMPTEYGGSGMSVVQAVAAFEGVAEGCPDGGFVYGLISQTFGVQATILFGGTPELAGRYLPAALTGEKTIAYAFTEPQGGSDAYLIETRADKVDDAWKVSGRKVLVTNSPDADVSMVFARTSPGRSPFALSAFMVDMSAPGAARGQAFGKVGLRTVGLGELIFDDVAVPADQVLGKVGWGLRLITESTNWERAFLLVTALGQMRRVLNQILEGSKAGILDGDFDQLSGPVAGLIWRYKLSRMAIYDLAGRFAVGQASNAHMQDAAITKHFVSRNYQEFMAAAMTLVGPASLLTSDEAQQHLRDSLASTIYSGTSETLEKTISKLSGLAGG
jgi:alkylation response protein AidB-like acyl-CoA dehydrogenase